MDGWCGTCGEEARATAENEGYSDCCNDRIEYEKPKPLLLCGICGAETTKQMCNEFQMTGECPRAS